MPFATLSLPLPDRQNPSGALTRRVGVDEGFRPLRTLFGHPLAISDVLAITTGRSVIAFLDISNFLLAKCDYRSSALRRVSSCAVVSSSYATLASMTSVTVASARKHRRRQVLSIPQPEKILVTFVNNAKANFI
jgi:hypothetical protein